MNKKYYLQSHEWIKEIENGIFEIGISHYAQNSLGEIVFIELPELETEIEFEKDFCVIESIKAASDLYSPVKGKIIETNKALIDNLELLNKDPENTWIVKVESDEKNLNKLMSEEKYKKYIENLED